MQLGERIKQLRNDKGLSQPELALAIGIEQSYLSKLENNKSFPSDEIFQQLLKALSVELKAFLNGFSPSYIRKTLTQLSEVEAYLYKHQAKHSSNSRKLLFLSSFLIVMATTFLYVGYAKILFSETHYEYLSEGVIKEEEPFDFYEGGWSNFYPDDKRKEGREALKKRYQPHQIIMSINLGKQFSRTVEGGTRTYIVRDQFKQVKLQNTWLKIIGVALLISGFMGFVLEFRLSMLNTQTT